MSAPDEVQTAPAPENTWPPPGTFWVTRDSLVNGQLEDEVDVWTAAPTRHRIDDFGGAYWLSGEWSLATRWGRYTLASFAKACGTYPATDLECIRYSW